MVMHKHATSRNLLSASYVLLLSGALVLTGCSANANGESPSSTSPASSSASGSATSSSTAAASSSSHVPQEATPTSPAKNIPEPVMPKAAKENTAKGLEAFTRYWFEVHNYAQKTGDTKQMMALCVQESSYCKARQKAIAQFSDRQAWSVGGDITTGSFLTQMKKSEGGYTVGVIEITQASRKVYTKNGPVREANLENLSGPFATDSIWSGGKWKFLAIAPIKGVEYSR